MLVFFLLNSLQTQAPLVRERINGRNRSEAGTMIRLEKDRCDAKRKTYFHRFKFKKPFLANREVMRMIVAVLKV